MRHRATTTPRKSPQQPRAEATVAALLTATARLLVREGYDKMTTNRIAREAGVSVGSLYQYFPSKEALVASLCEQHSREMLATIQEKMILVAAAPIPVLARELVRVTLLAHRKNPELHRAIGDQVPRIGRLEKVKDSVQRISDGLRQLLELRRADIRPENLDLAAFLLTRSVEALMHAAVLGPPPQTTDDEMVDEVTRLVLGYLIPTSDTKVDREEPAEPRGRPRTAHART